MSQKKLPDVLLDYEPFLEELKNSIRRAQVRAVLAVNQELIGLYWEIGRQILVQENEKGWGAKVVDQLATDLRKAFPEIKGFSARNLRYMKAFADAYADNSILQAGPAKLTWYHNCTILDKVKNGQERLWYAQETVIHGWTRDVLVHQIESNLYSRQGSSLTNFEATLPTPQSELAQQLFKDPYNFEFLILAPESFERDLEKSLLEKLKDFLLELGSGFAFVGSQYHLEVGGQDYFLDLLFYHLKMRCFVVIDLKITDFKPEYVGKMGFYLSAVDDCVRHTGDRPSIGLILCKTRNSIVAEYALRNTANPMAISEYRTQPLPLEFKQNLPSIEKLEKELKGVFRDALELHDSVSIICHDVEGKVVVPPVTESISWSTGEHGIVTATMNDFTLRLEPKTGARWLIHITHKNGYSHPWPRWQDSLESAKRRALECLHDAREYVRELKNQE